jgi:DNA-binding transcriptional MerR regulator
LIPSRRSPPVKLYYRIGEVAEAVGVQPHVLRYWEAEFGSIRPQKSSKGQRVYSHKDLEKLLRVKELLHSEGYTIAGAKKKLRQGPDMIERGRLAMQQMQSKLTQIRGEIEAELANLELDG